jgi:hypothetical protein
VFRGTPWREGGWVGWFQLRVFCLATLLLQVCHIPTIITIAMLRGTLPHNMLKTSMNCKLPDRLVDRFGLRNSKWKNGFAQYPISYAGEIDNYRSEGMVGPLDQDLAHSG